MNIEMRDEGVWMEEWMVAALLFWAGRKGEDTSTSQALQYPNQIRQAIHLSTYPATIQYNRIRPNKNIQQSPPLFPTETRGTSRSPFYHKGNQNISCAVPRTCKMPSPSNPLSFSYSSSPPPPLGEITKTPYSLLLQGCNTH